MAKSNANQIKVDICILGAGPGGLALAIDAVQMGARVVLIERGVIGAAQLRTGAVPSKALLAAAKQAYRMRRGDAFGIPAAMPVINFAQVMIEAHDAASILAPNVSQARLEALGVTVLTARARFKDRRRVVAGDMEVRARRIVIATGSHLIVPPVPGLAAIPYFTTETIFDNLICPVHLIVLGNGPEAIELAQAHCRLGARVTLITEPCFLPTGDPELSAILADALAREGIEIVDDAICVGVAGEDGRVVVTVEAYGTAREIEGTHLLLATARAPNVKGLELEKAAVIYDSIGIKVNARQRTTNWRIYAIGDVTGGMQLAHAARHQASIVLRNTLFRLPARVESNAVPWVVYTDPEFAHIGENEEEARARHMKINVLRAHLASNDRAQLEREKNGVIKIITDQHGRILGVSIVAPNASELILPWMLAKTQGLRLANMAALIAPYPSYSEISTQVAGTFYAPTLFGLRTRAIVRFLRLFG